MRDTQYTQFTSNSLIVSDLPLISNLINFNTMENTYEMEFATIQNNCKELTEFINNLNL